MHNFYRSIWLNRKQLCMSAVDMLSEGMGKKVKDIMVSLLLYVLYMYIKTLPYIYDIIYTYTIYIW